MVKGAYMMGLAMEHCPEVVTTRTPTVLLNPTACRPCAQHMLVHASRSLADTAGPGRSHQGGLEAPGRGADERDHPGTCLLEGHAIAYRSHVLPIPLSLPIACKDHM